MGSVSRDRVRGWCYTLNNYTNADVDKHKEFFEQQKIKYHVFGFEVGESGTPHLQGYIEFENPREMGGVKKLMPKAHLEKRYASPIEASNYCKKGDNFLEWGEVPKQGERKDLLELRDKIIEGGVSAVDEIVMNDPMAFHMYGRTLERVSDVVMMKTRRREMTEGVWLFGKTGVGKTHRAYEMIGEEDFYNVPDDRGWWDNYRQQKYCLLNDFRGSVKFSHLLEMADKYAFEVPRRGRPPLPFVSKKIIVTSSLPPEKIYMNKCGDDFAQIYRRFKVYEVIDWETMREHVYNDNQLDE